MAQRGLMTHQREEILAGLEVRKFKSSLQSVRAFLGSLVDKGKKEKGGGPLSEQLFFPGSLPYSEALV